MDSNLFNLLIDQLKYQSNQPMIFNSGLFMFLFAFFLIGFFIVHKNHRSKIIYTILFSLFFYYKSSGWYFLILIGSTLVDYSLASLIFRTESQWKRKFWLVVSLVLNLGLLGYFKYTNFLLSSFSDLIASNFQPLDIFLPVGVSFFTFQSLSYTIDIYRKEIQPLKNILDYAFFVSFFPQLVAGPIVRAKDFIPQISRQPNVTREMFGSGVFLICTGLFKKAIISDYISVNFVDRIFDNPMLYSGFENLMGVYGYTLQIFCDFSGYSDMAIGIALLFGFQLCINFDSPYQSVNITEFWRRWHISLSTWLRDYLYISMGGSRKGKLRTYINLLITMLLGGLWHGAGVKFILWGLMHGSGLVAHKLFVENKNRYRLIYSFFENNAGKIIAWFITFHFTCFCWIFFRASDMSASFQIINQITEAFSFRVIPQFIIAYPYIIFAITIGYVLHFTPSRIESVVKVAFISSSFIVKILALILTIFLVTQIKSSQIIPFIYFQF